MKVKYPHFNPHLSIVQVGARDDSTIYVRMKEKAAKEVCIAHVGSVEIGLGSERVELFAPRFSTLQQSAFIPMFPLLLA
ncbi:hypothetical protein BC936DRAFT_148021 [Jimgerdemannia flammicorona]|uniref:Uncharacterized protein n=2 Tax=Jimgerdemannia flammicorona TaxID=994334 RepID=A0A433Q1W8_9FUNG|nr:hypothetical protein BC936DRAFT_148021 [Jimgerdemannia flammicorona]RUS23674.1 hypothetical protein BC938DRAFT_474787 [Jimgerdemannia flammicorona]